VQLALRTMTGGPFRRLQELAAVLRGWFVNVCERRRRRIWGAACQSAIGPAHYDRRSVSPTAGARGCAAWMVSHVFASDEGGEHGGRLSEGRWYRVAGDRARHTPRPTATGAELRPGDGDDFDAGLSKTLVRLDISL